VRQKPMLSFAHRLRRMLERYESIEEVKATSGGSAVRAARQEDLPLP
jgi:hypothetical protein